jgi:hypothetical protein
VVILNIFLSSHTLKVGDLLSKPNNSAPIYQYHRLDRFPVNNDLLPILESFLESHKIPSNNAVNKLYMEVRSIKVDDRLLYGVIGNGFYGLDSELVDIKTNKKKYQKQKTDADVMPFYFLISLPKGRDVGVVLFQRIGTHGIQTNFNYFLNKFFSRYSPYRVFLETLMPYEILRKIIMAGTIKQFKCVKYKTPVDITDSLDPGQDGFLGDIEISVKSSNIPIFERIKLLFDQSIPVTDLVELRDFKFNYDTVKIDLEYNRKVRTYDLGDFGRMKPYLDITDEIEFDTNDKPKFVSIHARALRYLEEINKSLYGAQC